MGEGGVHEIDAEATERVGLLGVGRVEESYVEHHVARRGVDGVLEADPQPGMALVPPGERLRGRGVGQGEKPGAVAPRRVEPLVQQGIFVVEHPLDPLPRDVAAGLAVDGIADRHVVGRHRLGHGTGGPAGGEEPAGNLLPGADFGETAVDGVVEVDGQRPLRRGVDAVVCQGGGAVGHRRAPEGGWFDGWRTLPLFFQACRPVPIPAAFQTPVSQGILPMAKSHKPVSPLDQVRLLLTAAEQNVLQSSMGSTIAKATREQVEAARDRARALRDKWRDLHDGQTRSTKRSPKAGGKVNLRSREKHELFDGAVKRLEARLAEFADGARAVVGKQAARLAAAVKPAKTARTAASRASRASVRSELKEAAAEMTRKRKVKRSKVAAKGGAKATAKAAAPAVAAPVAVTPVHKKLVGAKLK